MTKINFLGGEPLLCVFLASLIRLAKSLGLVTSVTTNGTRLTEQFLVEAGPFLDSVSLSIDSLWEPTNIAVGRGRGRHVQTIKDAVERLRKYPSVRCDINTVVTFATWKEDFHDFIAWVRPGRWKVHQVALLRGENENSVQSLLLTPREFESFVERHRDLSPIVETAQEFLDDHFMLHPDGRLFADFGGRHRFSDNILTIGVEKAFGQILRVDPLTSFGLDCGGVVSVVTGGVR